MNFKKIVDHCVKHKFLSPNFSHFSFLGEAVQRRLEQEWFASNVTQNSNSLFSNSESTTRVNAELVQLFLSARTLMGSNSSITLASSTCEKKSSNKSTEELKTVTDLLEALPQTHLNLCMLTQPAQRIYEFTRLQKSRRRWWKSYLQQPVLLNSVSVEDSREPFVEQKIEFGSSALGSEPFEVLRIYKPDVFDDMQVSKIQNTNVYNLLIFICYFTVGRRHKKVIDCQIPAQIDLALLHYISNKIRAGRLVLPY